MATVPDGYHDLLERPLYGHLATARPDGAVQANPMWFGWDGELLRFTHKRSLQRAADPASPGTPRIEW